MIEDKGVGGTDVDNREERSFFGNG